MSTSRLRATLPAAGQWLALLLLAGVAVLMYRWHGLGSALLVDVDADRALLAGLAVAAYAGFCGLFALRTSRGRTATVDHSANAASADDVLVIHSSQTGSAEALAVRTVDALRSGGAGVRSLSLGNVDAALLARSSRALFVVSTTGEGDPPDDAYAFVRDTMSAQASLAGLQFGLLALGDRAYETFCGFGRALDHWLRENGAHPLFDTVEVDDGDEGALRHWQHQLVGLGGRSDAADWSAPAYESWRLAQRRVLNEGSPGAAAVHLRIEPVAAAADWEAGDIVEILPGPIGSALPHREYSIASIPADGAVELLVRQVVRADGTPGLGSGWLTARSAVGDTLALRVRRNASFHAPDNDRPMILVGNGTGIAGLRAHLRQRAARGWHRNWLLFGERTRAHDLHFGDEIERWRVQGQLQRVDLAFSRDAASGGRYVQHLLSEHAATLREWVAEGAAIYVCGSLDGMAPAVDAALVGALGAAGVERLRIEGRYRRDVY